MAGRKNAKLKLLFLMEIFLSQTDESHIYSATELCRALELCGITAERKSVYSDIETLREFGFEIIHARSPKSGYYMVGRIFEPAELRLFYDAVRAAPFLTEEQAHGVLQKLANFISKSQMERLEKQAQLPIEKESSEPEAGCADLAYLIETLSQAIDERKQVGFLYVERMITPYWETRSHEMERKVHPDALVVENGHYYLLCREAASQPMMGLRLDRLRKLRILDEDALPACAQLHRKRHGTVKDVSLELRCDKRLLEAILLRFGEQTPICADGPTRIRARVQAHADDNLTAWLIQQGGNVEVLQPEALRSAMVRHAQKIIRQYHGAKSE